MWPFRRSRAANDAERLLATLSTVSRNPALFGEGRVPDTLQGRFEVIVIHATLALTRLRAAPGTAPLAQHFTDRLFRHLDAGLREAGVGDLAVPKRMRKLAGDFFGRANAYSSALGARDASALESALLRNIVGLDSPFAASLSQQIVRVAAFQAERPVEQLFAADGWIASPG